MSKAIINEPLKINHGMQRRKLHQRIQIPRSQSFFVFKIHEKCMNLSSLKITLDTKITTKHTIEAHEEKMNVKACVVVFLHNPTAL